MGESKDPVVGSDNYRSYVGPYKWFDIVGALQFNVLTVLGLREYHSLLDIGCGSLRAGRLLIPYLLPGNYYGIEPNEWLINDGIEKEIGRNQVEIKNPKFLIDENLNLVEFKRCFDFIIAQSVFTHSPLELVETGFFQAEKVMEKSSIFVVNFKVGKKNYDRKEWVYPGCVTYSPEKIKSISKENNLRCRRVGKSFNNLTWFLIVKPEFSDRKLNRLERKLSDFFKLGEKNE